MLVSAPRGHLGFKGPVKQCTTCLSEPLNSIIIWLFTLLFDWCYFYYSIRSSLEASLEALCTRIFFGFAMSVCSVDMLWNSWIISVPTSNHANRLIRKYTYRATHIKILPSQSYFMICLHDPHKDSVDMIYLWEYGTWNILARNSHWL